MSARDIRPVRLPGRPVIGRMRTKVQCVECSRVFNLLDEDEAGEWYYGHDCDPGLLCPTCWHPLPHREAPALGTTVCDADGCECPGERS